MNYSIQEDNEFKFIETNGGNEVLMLLHGLFGALSNFGTVIDYFGERYNVVVPMLPIFELPLRKVSLSGLVDHVFKFSEKKGYDKVHLLGNSLGGHIALLYALGHPERVKSITLAGSSGLFENSMGSSFPKRGDYDFIERKTRATFFDPEVATRELIDEVFDIVNDRNKGIRIIATAKSAVRHNLGNKLDQINVPTLLIWGKDDSITPAFVGEKFHELISDSRLYLLDECGHVPMMEHPKIFNDYLEGFLEAVNSNNPESVGL